MLISLGIATTAAMACAAAMLYRAIARLPRSNQDWVFY
jgi:hypothetical protein